MICQRPSHRDSVSLLAAAWFYAFRSLTFAAILGLIALAAWRQDGRWLSIAGYCSPVWVGLTALILVAGQRAHCAICTGLLFSTMQNVKHPDASRFLGSYRLWTALQVIFTVSYRCHHCGTTVTCLRGPKREKRLPRAHHRQRIPLTPQSKGARREVVFHAKIGAVRKDRNRKAS